MSGAGEAAGPRFYTKTRIVFAKGDSPFKTAKSLKDGLEIFQDPNAKYTHVMVYAGGDEPFAGPVKEVGGESFTILGHKGGIRAFFTIPYVSVDAITAYYKEELRCTFREVDLSDRSCRESLTKLGQRGGRVRSFRFPEACRHLASTSLLATCTRY